jgi:OOP family OmpA-OmpF porin
MNTRAKLLAGAALLAIPAYADAGPLRGTYASVEAGGSWVRNENFSLEQVTTSSPSSTIDYQAFINTFDTGWAIFGTVGYAFESGIRTELELGYRMNNAIQDGTGSTIHTDGELREFTIMANALYDIDLTDDLSLSVGAGVGVDRARFTIPCACLDEDSWSLAYQGIAGLNYALGSQTQLFVNYRYLHVEAPEYNWFTEGTPGTDRRVLFLGDLNKHAVTFGLRYALYGRSVAPLPPAPIPEPPAPPPPAPPPAPEQFVVFFGFNKANITGEAMQVITDAARVAKETGAASILIVGHTDSSGSDKYNEALSQRRASAVKSALVDLGIEEGKISATGKGESELIVKTGDGVKEPQNRRATIDLK